MKEMRSLLFPILLLPLVSTAAPSSNACSPANVVDCETLKKSETNLAGRLGFPAARDGSVIFNSYALLSRARAGDLIHPFEPKDEIFLDHMNASSPGRQKATLDFAERMRREAIEMVRGDIRNDQLSPAQRQERDAYVKRLETLQFKFVSGDERKCMREVPSGFPNAAYRAFTHSIEMCPAFASQPNEAIALALAHELGHPVSACEEKSKLYRVVTARSNREELRNCDQDFVSSEESWSPEMGPYLPFLRQLEEGTLTHMMGDDQVLRTLQGCGIISQIPEGETADSKIFAPTRTCIERQYATDHVKFIEAITENYRAFGQTSEQARTMALRDSPLSCFGPANEHFSDSFAAKLLERFAEKERYSSQQLKTTLLGFAGYACAISSGGFEDTMEYPPWARRFQVMTSGRYISSRLSCEPPPARDANVCELHSTTLTETAAPAATSAKKPTRSGGAHP